MTRRHEPRNPVERSPKIVIVARSSRSRIDSHADSDITHRTKLGLSQSLLRGEAGRNRLNWIREGHAEHIAYRLKDVPVEFVERLAHQAVVQFKRTVHRLWKLLPEPGAAFDVSEDKSIGLDSGYGQMICTELRLQDNDLMG